jgi:hypothetical protein
MTRKFTSFTFKALLSALAVLTIGALFLWRSTNDGIANVDALKSKLARVTLEEQGRLDSYDDPSKAAEYFHLKRAAPQKGTRIADLQVPYQKYVVAIDKIFRMPQYSTRLNRSLPSRFALSHLGKFASVQKTLVQGLAEVSVAGETPSTWAPLGPGNIAGRTRALIIDSSAPSVMYAAAAGGGVWKSSDSGTSWTPVADFLANITVNSLAMDPNDHQVLYAGTGEGYFNIDAARGAGIFRSSDAGRTWPQLESTKNPDFYYVQKIAVSPSKSGRIYVATGTGVFKSNDAGLTWIKVVDGKSINGCMDLAIQSDRVSGFIFASCGNFKRGAVFRGSDSDTDNLGWQEVFNVTNMGRTSLAIAPSNQNIIYALSASNEAPPKWQGVLGVFRSDSSGSPGTWKAQVTNASKTKLNTVLLSNSVIAFYGDCGFDGSNKFVNQGWYDNVIAVDPTDPNIVWAGGTDLFRSNDGGRSWGLAGYWWFPPTNSTEYLHADVHAIVFNPAYGKNGNNNLFVGTDGGIFQTSDTTAPVGNKLENVCGQPIRDSIKWTALNTHYSVTQFYYGLPFPDGTAYFGGAQDNGTNLGSDATGKDNWKQLQAGDGGFVALDPSNPAVLYASFTGPAITKSTDGGLHFSPADTGLCDCASDCAKKEPCTNFGFITPFVMDPSDSSRLWTGGDRLFCTKDGANTWKPASNVFDKNNYPQVPSGVLSAIAIAPTDPNTILAGFAPSTDLEAGGGWIHRTDKGLVVDESTPWPRVRPRAGWVSSIAIDPVNPQIAYVTYSSFNSDDKIDVGHVWKSIDRGATWVVVDGKGETSIPDIPVHSIVINPRNTKRLYVGTDLGVFTSSDGAASWKLENTGFPNVITSSLAINPKGTPHLFAFTHGRGAWRVDLPQ